MHRAAMQQESNNYVRINKHLEDLGHYQNWKSSKGNEKFTTTNKKLMNAKYLPVVLFI